MGEVVEMTWHRKGISFGDEEDSISLSFSGKQNLSVSLSISGTEAQIAEFLKEYNLKEGGNKYLGLTFKKIQMSLHEGEKEDKEEE